MPLQRLQKEIYKKDANLPKQKPDIFRPEYDERTAERPYKEWQQTQPKKKFNFSFTKMKKYFIWSGTIILIAVLALLAIWGSKAFRSFDKSRIDLNIEVPQTIESGERISLIINYTNNNKIALKNAKLYLEYPSDSLPLGEGFSKPTYFFTKNINIGDISPRGTGRLDLPIQIFGSLGEKKEIKARLTYMPENFTSQFENNYAKITVIENIPISLDWQIAKEAVSGQEFEAKLSIINSSLNDFYNLRVNIEYPEGFTFESANPAPSEGKNTWDFEKIAQTEEKEITIRGQLSGLSQEQKPFKARIGTIREKDSVREFILYEELQTPTRIVASPLFIAQSIRGIQDNGTKAGNVLNYTIQYKNNTNVGIEKVEIAVEISGEALDFTTLSIDRGSFDSLRNVISWRGGQAQELNVLAPNESGELTFRISVKDPLPIEKFSDKNFIITSRATIDSSQMPSSLSGTKISGESTLVLKVNSDINLRQKGYYFESPISNSGPLPPMVNQTTMYNIVWQITNTSNDIEDVKVESYLPAYVSWQGKIEPKGADIFYDNATKKITWSIGKLPAQTGILLPIKQVTFQVGLTPSLSHLGKILDIIGEVSISGKDAFTEKILQDFAPVVLTDLPDDPFVEEDQKRVAQ